MSLPSLSVSAAVAFFFLLDAQPIGPTRQPGRHHSTTQKGRKSCGCSAIKPATIFNFAHGILRGRISERASDRLRRRRRRKPSRSARPVIIFPPATGKSFQKWIYIVARARSVDLDNVLLVGGGHVSIRDPFNVQLQ